MRFEARQKQQICLLSFLNPTSKQDKNKIHLFGFPHNMKTTQPTKTASRKQNLKPNLFSILSKNHLKQQKVYYFPK